MARRRRDRRVRVRAEAGGLSSALPGDCGG